MKIMERVREFWNRRPCNIKHSPKPVGTREYFDEVETRKYFVEPHIHGFAQFDRWHNKKILEIGCGIGTDSVSFVRAGAHLTAIDISDQSLELCRKRLECYNLNAKLYCGNAENLSNIIPVEPYDLIYSFGVIHHTPNPEKVLSEIKKYCKPETEIKIMFYSKWCWKVLWIILKYSKGAFWKTGELVKKYSEAQTGCPVTYYYSFSEIKKIMKDFEILEIRKDHIFPYVIDDYVRYRYKKVWYLRFIPRPLFRRLENKLGWHTLITARLKG